jgi:VIT1/CCC1 family predicted Fe2+/Mn2+ transporter
MSDSFGIHIFQESEHVGKKEVWLSTLTNFVTRLLVSLTFIVLIIALPIKLAAICSVVWGLSLLAVTTYTIAKQQKINPYPAILVHVSIAILVVIASNFIGAFVIARFQT